MRFRNVSQASRPRPAAAGSSAFGSRHDGQVPVSSSAPLPPPRNPDGPYRVCCVCLGNICRSPMAEARRCATRCAKAGGFGLAGGARGQRGHRRLAPRRADAPRLADDAARPATATRASQHRGLRQAWTRPGCRNCDLGSSPWTPPTCVTCAPCSRRGRSATRAGSKALRRDRRPGRPGRPRPVLRLRTSTTQTILALLENRHGSSRRPAPDRRVRRAGRPRARRLQRVGGARSLTWKSALLPGRRAYRHRAAARGDEPGQRSPLCAQPCRKPGCGPRRPGRTARRRRAPGRRSSPARHPRRRAPRQAPACRPSSPCRLPRRRWPSQVPGVQFRSPRALHGVVLQRRGRSSAAPEYLAVWVSALFIRLPITRRAAGAWSLADDERRPT